MSALAERQGLLLLRRILGGAPQLAQLWFSATVLDRYRGNPDYKVIRTDTVGRVRGSRWLLDFGIAGEDDSLIHVSAGELAAVLPESEHAHWAAHVAGPPVSSTYVAMQLSRGACIDDGDVRSW